MVTAEKDLKKRKSQRHQELFFCFFENSGDHKNREPLHVAHM